MCMFVCHRHQTGMRKDLKSSRGKRVRLIRKACGAADGTMSWTRIIGLTVGTGRPSLADLIHTSDATQKTLTSMHGHDVDTRTHIRLRMFMPSQHTHTHTWLSKCRKGGMVE